MGMEKYGTEQQLFEIRKKASFNDEKDVVAKNLNFDEAVKFLEKDANYELIPQPSRE